MDYNQKTDYKVSRETAFEWWKEFSPGKFQVHGVSEGAKLTTPEEGARGKDGLWVILAREKTMLAAVAAQPLAEDFGQWWGLSLLWYDREKSSWCSKMLSPLKLSGSKEVAVTMENVMRQRGAFPISTPDQPAKPS